MDISEQLLVKYQHPAALRSNPKNARLHSNHQVRQIAGSITEFGFTNPVLLDGKGMIVAGHGRVAAAKLLGLIQIPTIELSSLTEDQARAYILADNALAEKASWSPELLKIELGYLSDLPDFDITLTGFSVPEIDFYLQEDDASNEVTVPVDSGPVVSQPGDLFTLGDHKLLCGSALDHSSFKQLMGSHKAQVVFADPPYNVKIDGHASGNGSAKHSDFAMASGEMTKDEFTTFLRSSFGLLKQFTVSGSVHYICMDWRHLLELQVAGSDVYDCLLNVCVWAKSNAGMGSFYRSQHEMIFVFRNGKTQHMNNIMLGKNGRNRSNIWSYPSINTLSKQSEEGNLLALHPTVKPTPMVADAILDVSKRGDIVVDPFLGSGTTLLAAERTGRRCRAIELEPKYVDTAIRRWQTLTGGVALHATLNKTFNQLMEERTDDN